MKIGHTTLIWTNLSKLTYVHILAKFHQNLRSGLREEVENVFNEDR